MKPILGANCPARDQQTLISGSRCDRMDDPQIDAC